MAQSTYHILKLSEIDRDDKRIVGEKAVQFGELMRSGFPIPAAFVIPSSAYFHFLKTNGLIPKITGFIETIHFDHPESLMQVASHIQKLFRDSSFPEAFVHTIDAHYSQLKKDSHHEEVIIRPSQTTDDVFFTPAKHELISGLQGEASLLTSIKETWAQLFSPQAIFSRHEQHIDHFRIGIALIVQQQIVPEKSGTLVTIDQLTNDKKSVIIEAIYGETNDEATSDQYAVSKTDLTITSKTILPQEKLRKKNKDVPVSSAQKDTQKLTDNQILDLGLIGKKLEQHTYFPQQITWALEKGQLFLLSLHRLATNQPKNDGQLQEKLPYIIKGLPSSAGIVTGTVHIQEPIKLAKGAILVLTKATILDKNILKKAAGIITEQGNRNAPIALAARELGIPTIVAAAEATTILTQGQRITMNGAIGEIYDGAHHYTANGQTETMIHEKKPTATKVYINLSQAAFAKEAAKNQADGIGMLCPDCLMTDLGISAQKLLIAGKKNYYVELLAQQLDTVCQTFAPHPVVLKVDTADSSLLSVVLETVQVARKAYDCQNLWIALASVRTIQELKATKKMLTDTGLHRSPTFRVWLNIETPAQVLSLEHYLVGGIDGISISPQTLTMLTLGIPNDNYEKFDEKDPAVLQLFEQVIKTAHKHKLTTSISGQAAALYPSLITKLIEWGITSISVSPDMVETIREKVREAERELIETRYHKQNA